MAHGDLQSGHLQPGQMQHLQHGHIPPRGHLQHVAMGRAEAEDVRWMSQCGMAMDQELPGVGRLDPYRVAPTAGWSGVLNARSDEDLRQEGQAAGGMPGMSNREGTLGALPGFDT